MADWGQLRSNYLGIIERSGWSNQMALDLYAESYHFLDTICLRLPPSRSIQECKGFNKTWARIFKEVEEQNKKNT